MPRENRKRGKKHKKNAQDHDNPGHYNDQRHAQPDHDEIPADRPEQDQSEAGPSWIIPKQAQEINPEAPFGYVEPDVKAYFRNVDNTIREWQEQGRARVDPDDPDVDPNEDRRMFFMAALTELRGKEKQLATDPDGSTILERMTYSMDDFVRRVFLDTLAGSHEVLARHRFASHVLQTLLAVAKDTCTRETKGIKASGPGSDEDGGELRTLTQLVLDLCDELTPSFSTLIMDPFASHVFRALLLLLSPSLAAADSSPDHHSSRSKKSEVFRARLGSIQKTFITDAAEEAQGNGGGVMVPPGFGDAATAIIKRVREDLGENEVRAMVTDKAASPVLRLLLELEALQGRADEPDSLMDRVTVGLVAACRKNPSALPEPSDFLGALLRDATSSHVLESIVSACPQHVFPALYTLYLEGKLPRLAVHPVANFVVAKAIARLDKEGLESCCKELDEGGAWGKVLNAGRAGVVRAFVERAAAIEECEKLAVEAVFTCLAIGNEEDCKLLIPCGLRIKQAMEYKSLVKTAEKGHAKAEAEASNANAEGNDAGRPHKRPRRTKDAAPDPLEPTVQGALLLQSLFRLHPPAIDKPITALLSLPPPEILSIAHHPSASRVLDAFLTSPTVVSKHKRAFLLSLIGHYHLLVDDRIGSRVGDRCWALADPYLKEKIGRSLVPHEAFLAASHYGRFFARGLNLYLLQKHPEEWKTMQANGGKKVGSTNGTGGNAVVALSEVAMKVDAATGKRKRKAQAKDEIDELFDEALGKTTKRRALPSTQSPANKVDDSSKIAAKVKDMGLDSVFNAIRAAPKGQEAGKGGHDKKQKNR